ncbi:MAG: hypothetical protein NVV74_03310 [Magnetospirillum sp.]|nr:hypothetical protein [Magnetospirillum sp.]
MLPLLTFASGLVAGIVGVRLLKTVTAPEGLKAATGSLGDKARQGLDQAQSGLRSAALSSLTAIEKSSASLRGKLETPPVEAVPEAAEAAQPARKAVPRKAKAASPAKSAETPKPVRKRAPRKAAKAEPTPAVTKDGEGA